MSSRSVLASLLALGLAASATPSSAQTPTGAFAGGVPAGVRVDQALTLSLSDAVTRALAQNLGVLEARQDLARTDGSRWVTLSELLPHVSGHLSESRQTTNLAAFGFSLPGVPPIVGPYNLFDARIAVSQSVFSLKDLEARKADEARQSAARYAYHSARDLVVVVTANVYLQTLAEETRLTAAQAQLATAEALYGQAQRLKTAGLVAGVDVVRAEVRVATERQHVLQSEHALRKSRLALARVIGLPVGQTLTLTDHVPFAAAPAMDAEAALRQAYAGRPDYQAALARQHAAEALRRAARAEGLPSVHVSGDYGAIGASAGSALSTYRVAGDVTVPVFQGGKVHGKVLEADAEVTRRSQEAEEIRAGIYYDLQAALLDVQAAEAEWRVASRGRELADLQLTQARDRFEAGVASHIEVLQAQEAVARAAEQVIDSLYRFNVAKVVLARASGEDEPGLLRYLGRMTATGPGEAK